MRAAPWALTTRQGRRVAVGTGTLSPRHCRSSSRADARAGVPHRSGATRRRSEGQYIGHAYHHLPTLILLGHTAACWTHQYGAGGRWYVRTAELIHTSRSFWPRRGLCDSALGLAREKRRIRNAKKRARGRARSLRSDLALKRLHGYRYPEPYTFSLMETAVQGGCPEQYPTIPACRVPSAPVPLSASVCVRVMPCAPVAAFVDGVSAASHTRNPRSVGKNVPDDASRAS